MSIQKTPSKKKNKVLAAKVTAAASEDEDDDDKYTSSSDDGGGGAEGASGDENLDLLSPAAGALSEYEQLREDNIKRNELCLREMGFEPKKPPAVKLPGMRGRQKILEKEVEESEEEIYIGRLEYKVLAAGSCGSSHAEPLFKYLKYVFFDKADKLNVRAENVCSATVEGKEILFFQYRVQGRRNGRLEYTPCAEMLDESAASEWEIRTVSLPSIPA